jgi:3-dehydroquinate synthetase
MNVDKKVEGGQLRFVLLRAIGDAFVSKAPDDLLKQTLDALAI